MSDVQVENTSDIQTENMNVNNQLEVVDDTKGNNQEDMMKKLQQIQQVQDLILFYKLAKDFITLSDSEIKKLMTSTKKGVPSFKKSINVKSTQNKLDKLKNGNTTETIDYTKKYLNVLTLLVKNVYPDDSNKIFKKRFEAVCNGKMNEDKFRTKLVQFWTFATKMRDGQIGKDDEEKLIRMELDSFQSSKTEEDSSNDLDEMPELEDDVSELVNENNENNS